MGLISRNLWMRRRVLVLYAFYLVLRSVYSSGYATWVITQENAVETNPAGIETFSFVLISMISAYIGLVLIFLLFCLHLIAQFYLHGQGTVEQKQFLSTCAYYLENGGNLFDDISLLLLSTRFVFITTQEECIPILFWESLSLVFLVFVAAGPSVRAVAAYIYARIKYGNRKEVTSRDYEGPYNRSLMLGPIFSFIMWIALSVQAGDALKYFGLIIGTLASLAVFIVIQLLCVRSERGFARNVALCSFFASGWTLALLLVPKDLLIPVFCNDVALLISLALAQILPGIVHIIMLLLPKEKGLPVRENPASNAGETVLISPASSEKEEKVSQAAPVASGGKESKQTGVDGATVLRSNVSHEVNMA